MTLPPLPVTVISGYLGAGKTSLINHLLRAPDGRRIMVMVNDFGALNIDADLLVSADEDTLTLSNGCICCTMGTELIYALADALDRRPRPDCLVIEASGVAQPEKIAAAAHAEPEMVYGGIVTLADTANLPGLLDDPMIGDQVRGQIEVADLVLLTKTDLADPATTLTRIRAISDAETLDAPHGAAPADLLLDRPAADLTQTAHNHDHGAAYASWSTQDGAAERAGLEVLLADPPPGLYRFKGRIALSDGTWVEAHRVGAHHQIAPCPPAPETRAVAIGPAGRFDPAAMEAHWLAIAH